MSTETPSIYSLPLFPLHFVLFPQFPLQLHVFEERYRAMISACIDRNQPFGVVLIAEGTEAGAPAVPHDIGCVARILAVKTVEDGRMNLLAVGEKRFRLLEYSEGDLPYLVGRVESLEDTAEGGVETARPLRDIHKLFRRYLNLLAECAGMALPTLDLPDDPTALGFCIAAFAQLPAIEKQRLLSMTDPQVRLKSEKRLLRQQIKELELLKENTDQPESPAEGELRVLIAERLDTSRDFWKSYIREARN